MSKAICRVAVANLMEEASHTSELGTQILFGETVLILETKGNWYRVVTDWDNYEGWVLQAQFTILEEAPKHFDLTGNGNGIIKLEAISYSIPAGANLPKNDNNEYALGKQTFTYDGNCYENEGLTKKEQIEKIARTYLNAPYTWGGRTHWGIDCSGLSAMVYKFLGIPLKAIAAEQILKGTVVDFIEQVQCGDLAFFANEEEQIHHVGILLSNDTIIHAAENAGAVVIDKFDNEGIISTRSGRRTHRLRVIKRYLE